MVKLAENFDIYEHIELVYQVGRGKWVFKNIRVGVIVQGRDLSYAKSAVDTARKLGFGWCRRKRTSRLTLKKLLVSIRRIPGCFSMARFMSTKSKVYCERGWKGRSRLRVLFVKSQNIRRRFSISSFRIVEFHRTRKFYLTRFRRCQPWTEGKMKVGLSGEIDFLGILLNMV